MKLPDIRTNRAVPELKSAKAAELPNQLRNINAVAQVARSTSASVANTIDTALDEEARLDAKQRGNQMKRDYFAGQQAILQEYHNGDKDPADLPGAFSTLRSDLLAKGAENISGRSNRYLQQDMDNFRTQVEPVEGQALLKVIESKSIMSATLLGRDTVDGIAANPDNFQADIDAYTEEINALTNISPEARLKLTDRLQTDAVTTAAFSMLEDKDYDGLQTVQDSKSFKALSRAAQSKLNTQINAGVEEALADDMNTMANEVMLNPDLLDARLKDVRDTTEMFADPGTEDFDQKYDKQAATLYGSKLSSLITAEDYDAVESFIREPEATRLLSQKQVQAGLSARSKGSSNSLRRQATSAQANHGNDIRKIELTGTPNLAIVENYRQMEEDAMASGDIGIAERARKMRVEAELTNELAPGYNALPTATLTEMEDLAEDALEWANSHDRPADAGPVAARLQAAVAASQKELVDDGAGYVVKHDPDAQEAYLGLETSYVELMTLLSDPASDPDERAAAAQSYAATTQLYQSSVQTAQTNRGIPDMDQTLLPANSELARTISTSLSSMNIVDRMDRLDFIASQGTREFNRDLARQLGGDSMANNYAMTALMGGDRTTANNVLQGENRMAVNADLKGDQKVQTGWVDAAAGEFFGTGLTPGDLGTVEGAKLIEGLRLIGFGGLQRSTLSAPDESQVKKDVTAALEIAYGKPVPVGLDGSEGRVMPYISESTGVRIEGRQLQIQAASLQDPAMMGLATGNADVRDSTGSALPLETAMMYGTFYPVGNGKFQIIMPNSYIDTSSPFGMTLPLEAGVVQDTMGNPLVIDMNKVPLPAPAEGLRNLDRLP
tara:strand:- start:6886 stop:9408 length:2523 start_codon:yes stop_codon:yes gene_type:complete